MRDKVKAQFQGQQVAEDLTKYFDNKHFSDFKIVKKDDTGDRILHVHRVVLAARSIFFESTLKPYTLEAEQGMYPLPKDEDFDVFSEMIYFLYTGRSPRLQELALELFALADKYQVMVLRDQAAAVLRASMCADTVCKTLVLADLHQEDELKQEALAYIAQNLSTVVRVSTCARLRQA